MKRLISLFHILLVISLFSGCSKDEDKLTVDIPTDQLYFSNIVDSKTIIIDSESDWKASIIPSSASSWLTLSSHSGNAGKSSLTIRTSENDLYSDREAEVLITVRTNEYRIPIIQSMQLGIILPQNFIRIPNEGGLFEVPVNHNVSFQNTIAETWITSIPKSRSLTSSTVFFKCEPNPTEWPRENKITFYDTVTGLEETLTVVQSVTSIIASSEPIGKYILPSWKETATVSVTLTIPYTLTIPDEAASWLQAGPINPDYYEDPDIIPSKGLQNIFVAQNISIHPRETRIIFESIDGTIQETCHLYQTGSNILAITDELEFGGNSGIQQAVVAKDLANWEVSSIEQKGNWCSVSEKKDNTINVQVSANNGLPRNAIIHVSSGSMTGKITVKQDRAVYTDYYSDKDVVVLQQATVGKGINLVVLGDGYVFEDLQKGADNKYEKTMREAAEHFFSVYPYSDYRNHFNVYMVVAESNEAGISSEISDIVVDTKFKATHLGGSLISVEYDLTEKYVCLIPDVTDSKDITAIMPVNSEMYAGACYMKWNGFTIGVCPISPYPSIHSFRNIILHESCGHGFGLLHDEYITYYNSSPPVSFTRNIRNSHQDGWYLNVDITDDPKQVVWKDLLNYPKYTEYGLGVYEGALWVRNIWRPEDYSCMVDNRDYFNAPSRWAIVKRIKTLSGMPYTLEQFVAEDRIIPPTMTRLPNSVEKFIPLAPPIIIEK